MIEMKFDEQKLIEDFYAKKFYLSYSGLNKLLYSPALFYKHYILQQREDKLESYLIDGKVIHCLLLDNGSFDEQFMLLPKSLPTGNTRIIIDRVYDRVKEAPGLLGNYTIEIIDLLKEINLHQSLKTDQQRIDKIITEETKIYWEFLKLKGSKDIIDDEVLSRCNEAVSLLRLDNKVCELLGLLVNEMENVELFNETLLFGETDKTFGLKGVIDNMKLDRDKKILYVNDLKTTGKTIVDFKETIQFYNYWAQAAIYDRLARYKFDELLDDTWKVQFNFIVIDKYNQIYCFEVSDVTMINWQLELENKLNEAEWHYKNRNYKLPMVFSIGDVIL